MKHLKSLSLSIFLILGASAILLFSDLEQRQGAKNAPADALPEIAIMQISSTTLLDTHVAGILDRLESAGYLAADHSNLRQFNPQGDMGSANTIAREIANGPYDLVFTSSTLALQTFAKANQNTRKIHVFGAVTDPYGTGVGITGAEPDQHPPYLSGIGSFQPVKKAFTLLKEMNPDIRKVGVVWNPGEQCSSACLDQARAVCEELGLTLIEAIATNTSEVAESARSLLSKGVEALWIGGDTVASASASMLINLAKMKGIPVFTNDPLDADKGALFGLGANYFTVGQYTADMALAIFRGKSPSEFRIENVVPEKLMINDDVLHSLGGKYAITAEIEQLRNAGKEAPLVFTNQEPFRVAIINLVENLTLETAIEGFAAGLKDSGLTPGDGYVAKNYCAQGEISQLTQIIEAAKQWNPDLILTVTTPALMAALPRVKDIPLVFTVASDPYKLNVFSDAAPENVCGVHDDPPVDELLDMARKVNPDIQQVGIVYDPSQTNSMISVEKLRKAGLQKNIQVLENTISTVSEITMATQSVIQRGAEAIIVSADNRIYTGFAALLKAAHSQDIPIYVTEMELIKQGADGGVGDDFFAWGEQSGRMAARVLAGEHPADIGFEITDEMNRHDPGTPVSPANRLLKLRIVMYSETEFAERCYEGLTDGIRQAGYREDIDYELKTYNAQGDMSTLSSIMSAVKSDQVDLLMVVSTPTLQAALRQAGNDTKIVFTGVGDGVKAGAGDSETDHLAHVTGISTRSPFKGMARMIHELIPGVRQVGTLFTPAEINSVLYKDWFSEALAEYGIDLVSVPVTSSAEVAQSAIELCQNDIQIVAQIVDNLTRPGFALIARKAQDNDLPVFAFDSDQMKDGAALCLARDYYDAGLEAAEKAVRVLRGESPASIPFSNTQSEKLVYNPTLLQKFGIELPDNVRDAAIIFKK